MTRLKNELILETRLVQKTSPSENKTHLEKRDLFRKAHSEYETRGKTRLVWKDLFNINFNTKLRDSFGKLDLLGKRDSFVKPDSLHQTCS